MGIYAPYKIKLEKYSREKGYEAVAAIFANISDKKSINNLTLMKEVPADYVNRCFKDIDTDPIH